MLDVPDEMDGSTLIQGKYRHVPHSTKMVLTVPMKTTVWVLFNQDRGQSGRFENTLKDHDWVKRDWDMQYSYPHKGGKPQGLDVWEKVLEKDETY